MIHYSCRLGLMVLPSVCQFFAALVVGLSSFYLDSQKWPSTMICPRSKLHEDDNTWEELRRFFFKIKVYGSTILLLILILLFLLFTAYVKWRLQCIIGRWFLSILKRKVKKELGAFWSFWVSFALTFRLSESKTALFGFEDKSLPHSHGLFHEPSLFYLICKRKF